MTELHDVTPEEAVESYLNSRHDVTASTLRNHEYRLSLFTDWCTEEDVETLSELTGFELQRYKNWRVNGESAPDCNLVTVEQHLHTLRVMLRWAESSDLAPQNIANKVVIPNVSSQDKARDVAISHERAREIIDFLSRYHWASRDHITFHTLYHCGMRRSGLHSLDVDDWNSDDQSDGQFIEIRHRPENGTRVKMGEEGGRNVSVVDEMLADAIDDWIANQRPDVLDEHGREPLIATKHGRPHPTLISKIVYKVSRPCFYTGDCPINREIDDCEATEYHGYSKCPENVSAHPLRRSSISHSLSEDVPKEIVSGRCGVSQDVLDLHYDARDVEQRRANRRRYLDDI